MHLQGGRRGFKAGGAAAAAGRAARDEQQHTYRFPRTTFIHPVCTQRPVVVPVPEPVPVALASTCNNRCTSTGY
jgi:hypothetical protein